MSSPAAKSTSPSANAADVVVVYDGECVFCASYVKLTHLRENLGKVVLMSARESDNPTVISLKEQGYNLNDGMAVVHNDKIYHGADAVHFLAAFTKPVGPFNALNKLLFTHKWFSKLVYPALRFGRNTTLWLRGRKQIEH